MEFAIETNNLSKHFGNVHAVQNVNLHVKKGEIYSFLGLNGAGKTTTIRALLGMIRPSEGHIKVLGQDLGPGGRGPWAQVGYMVESPSAYPELSVRENLEVARRLQGIQDPGIVDRVMQQLSITAYADRKAGTLSSGNFQRLGLARAMMHKPALLILDEPANALDPAGIVEIREMIVRLAREEGMTIFMSSHNLTEVDKLADRIGIIHKGKLVEELDADRLDTIRAQQLIVDIHDLVKACAALENFQVVQLGEHRLAIKDRRAIEAPETIATLLVEAGAPPYRLAVEQEDLENYFLNLTAN
jgi:ABC-2 type transport system ATP-binding protein